MSRSLFIVPQGFAYAQTHLRLPGVKRLHAKVFAGKCQQAADIECVTPDWSFAKH